MPKAVKAKKETKPKSDPVAVKMADLNERVIGFAEKRIEDLKSQLRRGFINQNQFFDGLSQVTASAKKLQPEAATLISMKANAALDEGSIIEQRGAATGMIRAMKEQKAADRAVRVAGPDRSDRPARIRAALSRSLQPMLMASAPSTTFGGERNVGDLPRVKMAVESAGGVNTIGQARSARSMVQSAAESAIPRARMGATLGRSAIGAGLLALLGKTIFGGGEAKKAPIDPQVQMALMQQLQGGASPAEGGVNTSRTLMDAGRLLTLLKGLQGMASLSGPTPTTGLV